ncbi:hypothetical protein N2605_00145 [Bradyrhizobium yuanmingense]|uniref:hypothetical protein n=1 Tax=Bradyrhizobium yuanmingense TaxID=108015 RepID=UPI0021A878E2|nr:hypothetical protein [Bradyrhizobium sp. CB1024]UWU84913.1 hypothetical protein N2605_00145 [Bradyrhizobium sp. CB1024]
MAGYNHYADCTCGWCVNYGRLSYSDRARLVSDMHRRDAKNLLKRESARSIAACYVNPNARCPECNASVYFYANEHGSRVFFDHLGPPWPKHPCTDIPKNYVPKDRSPQRRARGAVQELISAANVVGLFDNKVFGRRAPDEWTVLIVLLVDRIGDENAITAEYLDSRDGETTTFACRSELPIFDAGDFINMRGDEISFIHKEALRPVFFRIGGTVTIPASPAEEARGAPPPPGALQLGRPRLIPAGGKGLIEDARGPMTEAEMIHFNSDKVDLGKLFGKLEPIVRAYAREHTRKPWDVARRLNAEGHRTANDARWTPRLVRFLLALMFNESKSSRSNRLQTKSQSLPNQHGSERKLPPVAMDDKGEIAKRLSTLGKVTVRRRN